MSLRFSNHFARTTLAAFLILAASNCAPDDFRPPGATDESHRLNQEGHTAYRSNQYDTAREKFEKAVTAAPTVALYHNNAGMACIRLGQYEAALKHISNAIDLEPTTAVYRFNRGLAQKATGRISEAIVDFTDASKLDPEYFEPLPHLGFIYLHRNESQRAAQIFQQATRLRQTPEMFVALGLAHLGNYDLSVASDSFRDALRLDPNYPDAHYNMGVVYQQQERYELAEASYRQTIMLQPERVEAYMNMAIVQTRLGKFENALTNFQNFIATAPPGMEQEKNDALQQIKMITESEFKRSNESQLSR